MYTKVMLGLEQCQQAVDAMIAEYQKNPRTRAIDVSIVDDMGNLLYYVRLDGLNKPTMSPEKAYTSAIRRIDSGAFADQLKSRGITLADMNDPRLVTSAGGVVVTNAKDGSILGGIGVGGLPTGKEDEDIARAGLKAMKLA